MNIKKNKIITAITIIVVLIGAYWWGGNAPGLHGLKIKSDRIEISKDTVANIEESVISLETPMVEEKSENKITAEKRGNLPSKKNDISDTVSSAIAHVDKDYSYEQGMKIDDETGTDEYLTEPVPEGKPIPIEPEDVVVTENEMTCVLSVRCDEILQNIDLLDPEKIEMVPQDGTIYEQQTVAFYEGESVFNVLLREMKQNKIHMEFVNTPIFNSAYIEGIHNIYEFDCGELSGWMYKVNDWFPNYGCSRYQLKDGDIIEWVYTCELGADVSASSSLGE